jgi:hypothetical protein
LDLAHRVLSFGFMLQMGFFTVLAAFPFLAFFVLDRATRASRTVRPAPQPQVVRVNVRSHPLSSVRIRQSRSPILSLEPPGTVEVSLN